MESVGEIIAVNSVNLKVKRVRVKGFEMYQVWVNDSRMIGQYWSEQLAQTRLAVEARKLSVKGETA